MSQAAPAGDAQLEPEDAARAGLYGMIARLFYAAPDQQLLGQILHAQAFEGEEGDLALAWRRLLDACRSAYPVVLENEHTDLFVGTGKSPVTPYLSNYVDLVAKEKRLVELRGQLLRWGIARREDVGEPEDHVAGVFEAMRFAIAMQHRSADDQKAFFEGFLYQPATAFCDAVSASDKAVFYRLVAKFTREFLDIEKTAFEML